MKLRDFLKLFDDMDGDLPVCLADWSECYRAPHEDVAEWVEIAETEYMNADEPPHNRSGKIIVIGQA
jgi:hypothetical protein